MCKNRKGENISKLEWSKSAGNSKGFKSSRHNDKTIKISHEHQVQGGEGFINSCS
jgi:hypothetical protein